MTSQTQYANNDGVNIAYQVHGEGPVDMILVPGWVSHVEFVWEVDMYAAFLKRLASFCRFIMMDRRGTGMSDPADNFPTLEQRMEDVRAVMDDVGSEKATIIGISEGGPMSILFAASYPERTNSLILYGTFPKYLEAPDYAIGHTQEFIDEFLAGIEKGWGDGVSAQLFGPSMVDDENFMRRWSALERYAVSPGRIEALLRQTLDCDTRDILPVINVPTLVLCRTGDQATPIRFSRYLAENIKGAKFVELAGEDHFPWTGDVETLLAEVEEFVTGTRHAYESDRVLATVLFTDIVDSTRHAVDMGDRKWRDLLERHHDLVRRELDRFRGREVDNAGDGFFVTFDGPARAVSCALAIRDAVASLGMAIRAGVHTGECEVRGEKVSGVAVHIGARVQSIASPNEILVSRTVKDLVVGSGLDFTDRGEHELKGVPGNWQLYSASA